MTAKKALGVLTLLTIISLIYSYKHLNSYPSHIHAWAQADRYALALGFTDNNLNFFKPQTFIYNHQFSNEWKIAGADRITAVDFPIHDYIPAIIMKVTGSQSPLIFRLYILIYSLIGLFFLFKLTYAVTQCFYKSLIVCITAATSPVFVYYQAGFLPTIPSLANLFIGLYFYFRYLKQNGNKNFALSILFLTLAALARTTYVIPLIALVGVEFVKYFKKESKIDIRYIAILAAGLTLISYQIFNAFLRNRYGSDFLNYPLPPSSFTSALELINSALKNWGFQYFSVYHYLVFCIIVFASSFYCRVHRLSISKPVKWLALYIIILTSGYMGFSILMLQQFPDHDYYFLDTFYISVILIFIFSLSLLPAFEKGTTKFFKLLVFIPMLVLLYQPISSQKLRYESSIWNKTQATVESFANASTVLDSAGISTNARMLVLDAVAPNLPFASMKRTGYAVMYPTKENIDRALQWPYDLIVMQDEFLWNELSYTFPEILSSLHRVAGNNKISVFRFSAGQKENPKAMIRKSTPIPAFTSMVDFEGNSFRGWTNLKLSDSVVYSGRKAGHLISGDEFGLTFRSDSLSVLKTGDNRVFITFRMLKQKAEGSLLVVKVNSNDKLVHYREFDLQELPMKEKEWQSVELMFNLPRIDVENYEFSVYLWNPRESEMYYDDFRIEILGR